MTLAPWTRRLLLLAPLAAFAAISWWVQDTSVPIAIPADEAPARRAPDYAMESFTVTEMLPSGEPNFRLQAAQLEHYADDNTAMLTQPRVEFYDADRVPWTLTADAGTSTGGDREIRLHGGVTIERPAAAQRDWMRMTTRDVLVRPHDEYAETAERVTIQDPTGTTQARGMRVYIGEERVTLLAEVRGTYATR